MPVTIQQLFAPVVLTTSAATIYTLPSDKPTNTLPNLRVRFTNTSGGTVKVTAYAIQPLGTAGAGNCCLNAESIAANAHLDLDIPVLGPGGFFQALSDTATAVTCHELSGTIYAQA